MLELAKIVWDIINPDKEFRFVSDEPFLYDVQKRIPNTDKAKRILGFEAEIPLEESIKEVLEWLEKKDG